MTLLRIDYAYLCTNVACRSNAIGAKTVIRWATNEGVIHRPGLVVCVDCGELMEPVGERRIDV